MEFLPFPSIEGFHNIVKLVRKFPDQYGGREVYRGKIKLHGTNAAVRIKKDQPTRAQSRNRYVTPGDDNCGFAKWVTDNEEIWSRLREVTGDLTIFGEWCGPGIMQGTAINQIPSRIFAIFCMVFGPEQDKLVTLPEVIAHVFNHHSISYEGSGIHILPFETGSSFVVDFLNTEELEATTAHMNQLVADVEKCDPWVERTFGVKGIGEGLVFYPGGGSPISLEKFNRMAFKAKGEQHRVTKAKESVQINPDIAKNLADFVKLVLPPARLQQAVTETNASETAHMGNFLKWICQDIQKENTAELEAAGLLWPQAQKAITAEARVWFLAHIGRV